MAEFTEQWVGAYYPREMMSNPRSRVILCLFFDKVICHFPVSDMACGGGHGWSEFYSDSPLVEEGVLELREEVLLGDVEVDFSPGYYWGTDKEFDEFLDLQITAMALNACADSGAVPVTDNPNLPLPISLAKELDFLRLAKLQAAALAIQSLDITIPAISEISDDDILKARDELREQLIPFRRSMLSLAPLVREGLQSEASVEEVFKEARYIAETNVAPTLDELKERLSKESGRFWRKLILKGSTIIPKFVLNWTTKDALSAAVASLEAAKDLASEVMDRKALLTSLKSQGGLGYLLSVADYRSFKLKVENG